MGIRARPSVIRTDMAPDASGRQFAEAAGRVGLASEFLAPEKSMTGESAHYRVLDSMRANNTLSPGVLDHPCCGYEYLPPTCLLYPSYAAGRPTSRPTLRP